MLDYILQFFLWWAFFELLFWVGRWIYNMRQAKELEQEITIVMQDIRENCKVVYIETVGNVHLMYDHLSGNFVCQGTTEDDLWQQAKLMFPGKEFIIKSDSDGVPLFTFKG